MQSAGGGGLSRQPWTAGALRRRCSTPTGIETKLHDFESKAYSAAESRSPTGSLIQPTGSRCTTGCWALAVRLPESHPFVSDAPRCGVAAQIPDLAQVIPNSLSGCGVVSTCSDVEQRLPRILNFVSGDVRHRLEVVCKPGVPVRLLPRWMTVLSPTSCHFARLRRWTFPAIVSLEMTVYRCSLGTDFDFYLNARRSEP